MTTVLYQPPIPERYARMDAAEQAARLAELKARLGTRLLILGHHYQQDDVINLADMTGDSLKLAQLAADRQDAEFVVLCGVHFMAETADMLTPAHVSVILPDLSAGCSMADMAAIDQLEEAWDVLTGWTDERIIPITYVNSSARIKDFCGRHGGACCTSSNAAQVLAWAFAQGEKVMFLPDQHLGRNTAYAMGIPLDAMRLWDPQEADGALARGDVAAARVLLWKGHCSVHQLFAVEQVRHLREVEPDRQVIVHPECNWDVVQAADLVGSTEFIIKTITNAPAGSKWAVGTEVHLVHRLNAAHPDQDIRSVSSVQCLCTTMYRISPAQLHWCLDELAAGRVVNRIQVPDDVAVGARKALQRMLDLASPPLVSSPS